MKHGTKTTIAKKTGISNAYLSMILSGKRRPSWQNAKKLAKVTHTKIELWMDGDMQRINEVLDAVNF
jgi:transcriptional regulator with XRE-family HTH domain